MNKNLFMKTVIFLMVLVSTVLSAVELNWGHDYNKALIQAKDQNKSVYLFIGADKCKHCKRFKKQTLSNKKLIDFMKKDYVLLYMSRDQHKIPKKFELYGAPRHYFLNSNGKIIADTQGSRELAGWYDVLDEVELIREESK
jgi:thioredoxin-related protein